MRDFAEVHSALALNTATLGHNIEGHGAGWSPEQVIDACAERGFGAITFWRREIGSRAVEIGKRTRAAGLEVSGLCRSPFLVGPLAPTPRQAVIDDFRSSIDMTAALDAACLTICVGGVVEGTHSMTESLKQVAEIAAEAAPYAAKSNVTLALEPLSPVYGGNRSCLVTVRDAVDLCETIGHPAIGIAVDVYHVWWDLALGAELKRAGAARIAGYHLCDWLADTRDVLLDRGMMGDGVADLKALRRGVEDAGYAGYCEVEVFSANNWWKPTPTRFWISASRGSRRFVETLYSGLAWPPVGRPDGLIIPSGRRTRKTRQVRIVGRGGGRPTNLPQRQRTGVRHRGPFRAND